MGKGYIKQKNAMKKLYLGQAVKEIQRLEKELEAIITDPDTKLGQVTTQAREFYIQNSRLSVLVAALLEAQGGSSIVKKASMDKYENHRIVIRWDLPEGITDPKDATEFVFTFTAVQNPPPGQAPAPIKVGPHGQEVQLATECNDPNCKLPKDLRHTHTAVPEAGDTIPLPVPANSDEPQSHRVAVVPQGSVGGDEELEDQPIVSNAMQGVDCPECEDGTEHEHASPEELTDADLNI